MPSFKNCVLKEFKSIEDEFDGTVVEKSSGLVVYHFNEKVELRVTYDNRSSYELDLTFRPLGYDGPGYTIQEVLDCLKEGKGEGLLQYQSTDAEQVNEMVARYAVIVKNQCSRLLAADRQAFATLARCRDEKIKEYGLQRDLKQARSEANEAWRKRDYSRYANVLKPYQDHLTPVELRKLDYAQRNG